MAYGDVPTSEAIDLVRSLPDGSAWVAATHPLRAWDAQRARDADALDMLATIAWALGVWDTSKVRQPPLVERPRDRYLRALAAARSRAARQDAESGEWEEV